MERKQPVIPGPKEHQVLRECWRHVEVTGHGVSPEDPPGLGVQAPGDPFGPGHEEPSVGVVGSRPHAPDQAVDQEVIPWLRALGFRADEARRASALSATLPGAPLEERVRAALSYFRPRARSHIQAAARGGSAP